MIIIDNIGNLKKCRIWLDNLPLTEYETIEELNAVINGFKFIKGRDPMSRAVELFVAPRYYALLGLEYIPKDTNSTEISVKVAPYEGKIIKDTLALPSDNVFSGVPMEYAQIILNTAKKLITGMDYTPSGVLNFYVGAYSDYGSNQVIFAKITSILIRIFVASHECKKIEILKDVVRKELDKPLTNI